MNTAPHDDLDIGDDNWTEERVAEGEVRNLESPGERWALFIRERSTAKLVALTRVYFYPTWPGHVDQGDTGVDTAHRNQGLGRWIKAAMIERILRERPDARRIRTSNAFSNDPMLAINDALGFKVTNALTRWQIATDALQAAL
jgi:RimJ/RimL family protein N-acetyltransferase